MSNILKRPTLATLVISRLWEGMDDRGYFQWSLQLFHKPSRRVPGGTLSTLTLSSRVCFGEQAEAVRAATKIARLFGLRIDRKMLYKEEKRS